MPTEVRRNAGKPFDDLAILRDERPQLYRQLKTGQKGRLRVRHNEFRPTRGTEKLLTVH